MSATFGARGAWVLFGGVVIAACGPQEIVVAELPATDAGGAAPCATNDDCPTGAFCAKAGCGAAAGRCERAPLFCDDVFVPSCGCDGVTYWNDCLRLQASVDRRGVGECIEQAASCGGREQRSCPTAGASCARVVQEPAPCRPIEAPGTCWMLPATCPTQPPTTPPIFEACALPGVPAPEPCADACNAIRSERPFRASRACRR